MVTFETKCWEGDWHWLLRTGYLAAQIGRNAFRFAHRWLMVNNVSDPERVCYYARRLVARGVLTACHLVETYAEEAMDFFGLSRQALGQGYVYSISELVALYLCRSPYLLHFSGDSILALQRDWVSEATRALEANHAAVVANPTWNERWTEPPQATGQRVGPFWIGDGFSDQCYLVRTAEFRARIYTESHPVSERFPEHGGNSFEKRVDAWMRNHARHRLTHAQLSYWHLTSFRNAEYVRRLGAVLSREEGDADLPLIGRRGAMGLCQPSNVSTPWRRASAPSLPDQVSDASRGQGIIDVGAGNGAGMARSVKVAILSFLFNWPSTGGGIVHTVELAQFLAQAGYQVRHFYAKYPPWQIGCVKHPPVPGVPLEFSESTWNLASIKARYREAVDAFVPDYVLITDSWNIKPHLADAMRGYPTLLRLAALECLCPLNNVRLLPLGPNEFGQCSKNQLANAEDCRRCLRLRGQHSGSLHKAERELARAGTAEYDAILRRAMAEAEAVLVLNPEVEAILKPFAPRVRVVPWGMDPARFPGPVAQKPDEPRRPKVIFQAGIIDEPMKGFSVLHAACEQLWQTRQDFMLLVTADPPRQLDPWTRFVGWKSQPLLPKYYDEADIVVVPTIAQEGLSRTSVEAMASGKPVVASRIGGLPYTVTDGETGYLYEPGNSSELAATLHLLLDHSQLRHQLGQAGRRRFEEEFTWPKVIDRYYRPLLARKSVPNIRALFRPKGSPCALDVSL